MTDPIADMLTRIRNASIIHKDEVLIPFSKIKYEVAKILEKEGFVKEIKEIDKEKITSNIHIVLKYKGKTAVIRGIKKISKPGLRIYKGHKEIPRLLPSLGLLIVSTSSGLMTNIDAKKKKMGGEILCEIF
ncbi:MAG: 30S ribosomal protein S8 [Candidatus Kerfeldbacteria bacterium]|jgi:small subunit ribosomal protein S8